MTFEVTVLWVERDGTIRTITADGTIWGAQGKDVIRAEALRAARKAGWTPRRWWQWWRWKEPRLLRERQQQHAR